MSGDLEMRMRGYEKVSRTQLMRRTPVIMRLDGKAFKTFTKGFDKPFDYIFHEAMNRTMLALCQGVSGCELGYTQSDEITLVLCDYQKLDITPWFDYEVQKLCSVGASMATLAFNTVYSEIVRETFDNDAEAIRLSGYSNKDGSIKQGMFDCRCFNLPIDEVVNCLIWRQQDATRNSIQSTARTFFPEKALYKKSTTEMQDMLFTEKGCNWNDFAVMYKRGCCCVKELCTVVTPNGKVERKKWVFDKNIPIFTMDPDYIRRRITFDENT